MSDEASLKQWLESLDRFTYYELLGIPKDATFDAIKNAFTAFAESFHPDAQSGRPAAERAAVSRIFKRGTEAYRVLSLPVTRAKYDESLSSGEKRFHGSASMMPPAAVGASIAPASMRLEDRVKNPAARPFVRRAEELLKNNDAKQAKLQLVMATHLDANNEALAEFMKQIEARIAADRKSVLPPK